MPARRLTVPRYLKHRCTGGVLRARVVLRWPDGKKQQKSLGRYGSPESYAEHRGAVRHRRGYAGFINNCEGNGFLGLLEEVGHAKGYALRRPGGGRSDDRGGPGTCPGPFGTAAA